MLPAAFSAARSLFMRCADYDIFPPSLLASLIAVACMFGVRATAMMSIAGQLRTRQFRDVSSMSAYHLIAAMADRGTIRCIARARPKKETPGTSAPGAIPILEFRNSYSRRRILSTQKRQRPYFSRPSSWRYVHRRNPAHSLQFVISISHPKRPNQRVEREAQIAEIARRPQRRVFVDADDAI
jgi:hypothetical protein